MTVHYPHIDERIDEISEIIDPPLNEIINAIACACDISVHDVEERAIITSAIAPHFHEGVLRGLRVGDSARPYDNTYSEFHHD